MPITDRTITNAITVEAPPQRVWDALTLERELNRWETTEAHLDLRTGGDFLYVYEYGPPRPGTFLVVEPPRRMVQVNMVFNQDRSYRYLNSVDLEPVADGTRVTVVVEGFGSDEEQRWLCESMDLGWETDLRILKGWVEEARDLRPELWRGLYLGVAFVTAPGGGVKLLEVFPGAPAWEAGLRPGDVVHEAGGRAIADFRTLRAVISDCEIGDEITLRGVRDGERMCTTARFADYRDAAPAGTTTEAEAATDVPAGV
jgi:uncharacterized protein YndB with AHSA1/START domain